MRSKNMVIAVALVLPLLGAGCAKEYSFKRDIHPVLKEKCGSCHSEGGEGYAASGFSVASYETLMKGTKFGAVIVPGSSVSSTLARTVEGKTHASIAMPRTGNPMSKEEIQMLKVWIDQGAKNN